MHFRSEEGTERRQMIVHEGQLTVMATASGSYAQGEVPSGLTKALDYALDNYGVDLPLMDLARKDTLSQLVEPEDSVLYLGDTARVQGELCHLVAIRTPEVDAQMWISKGDKPLPRRIVLTSKWAGGAPRFIAEMNWEVAPKIGSTEFEFKPPEGASRIEFLNAPGQ